MNVESARTALQHLLVEKHKRDIEHSRHSPSREAEFEDEADIECPFFQSFYDADGNEVIVKMINFTSVEFVTLYKIVHDHVVSS